MSEGEYRAARWFCECAMAQGLSFDVRGLYLATVHCGGCLDRKSSAVGRTFCSKIITEALQYADLPEVASLSPSATTPSRLYDAVRGSPRRMCHVVRRIPYLKAPLPIHMSGSGSVT